MKYGLFRALEIEVAGLSGCCPPSQKAANFSWRMNAERVSAEAVLAVRRIAAFIANMISVGGCASAGFAEAGALVPSTAVGGAPLNRRSFRGKQSIKPIEIIPSRPQGQDERRPQNQRTHYMEIHFKIFIV
jgi:hypothetical protein